MAPPPSFAEEKLAAPWCLQRHFCGFQNPRLPRIAGGPGPHEEAELASLDAGGGPRRLGRKSRTHRVRSWWCAVWTQLKDRLPNETFKKKKKKKKKHRACGKGNTLPLNSTLKLVSSSTRMNHVLQQALRLEASPHIESDEKQPTSDNNSKECRNTQDNGNEPKA